MTELCVLVLRQVAEESCRFNDGYRVGGEYPLVVDCISLRTVAS
jgi:hypothetical protein